MSPEIPLVVVYQIGDGYTFSAVDAVPVLAESKEAFLSDFELAMAGYEPGGVEHFSIGGQLFEYRHFIEWRAEQITPRRARETYEAIPPEVLAIEEWIDRALRNSRYLAGQSLVNIVNDGNVVVANLI
jgi:hypothetical protein